MEILKINVQYHDSVDGNSTEVTYRTSDGSIRMAKQLDVNEHDDKSRIIDQILNQVQEKADKFDLINEIFQSAKSINRKSYRTIISKDDIMEMIKKVIGL